VGHGDVRHNGGVTDSLNAPRHAMVGVVIVWSISAVIAVVIGILAPPDWRAAWMGVGLGLVVSIAFAVHLWSGRSQGFIQRVALSVLGSMLVMGLIGVGLGLATLFSVNA
jgi:hypothetical protein